MHADTSIPWLGPAKGPVRVKTYHYRLLLWRAIPCCTGVARGRGSDHGEDTEYQQRVQLIVSRDRHQGTIYVLVVIPRTWQTWTCRQSSKSPLHIDSTCKGDLEDWRHVQVCPVREITTKTYLYVHCLSTFNKPSPRTLWAAFFLTWEPRVEW